MFFLIKFDLKALPFLRQVFFMQINLKIVNFSKKMMEGQVPILMQSQKYFQLKKLQTK